ncbi:DNRLRE domain-containing protein, partial [bacterium]|nr:DNRLRE domain-containing protein [bacterium]
RYHIELMMHYFSPGIAQYEKGFEVYNEIIKKFPNVSPQYMMPFTLPTLGENIVLSAFKKLNQWDLYFQAKKGQLSNAMLDGPGTLALLSSSYAEYLSKPKESADALSLRRFIEIIRSNNQKQIYAAVIAVVFTLFISVILIPREKKSKVRIVTICLIVLSVSAAVFFAMFFYSRLLQGKAYQINRRRLTVEAAANDGLSEDVDINKWIMGIRGDQINCVSINSKLPEQNFQNKELRVGKDNIVNRGTWRALINFKIPKVQTTDFVSAKLYLYGISPDFAGFSSEEYLISPMEILEVPLAWDYMRTTWNNRMENTMWQVPGGDIIGEAIPMDDLLFDEKGKRYVYMFELADLIKEKIKNGETACGLLIKEYDEENSFPRQSSQFYGDNTSLSPKIVLVFKSESRPEIDNLIEYQYDWIDFYKVGMDALVKRDLDKTLAYWKKSAELIEDYWIKIEVQKHIDIIKKALSEEII